MLQERIDPAPVTDTLEGPLLGIASDHFHEAKREFLQGCLALSEAGHEPTDIMLAILADLDLIDRRFTDMADEFGKRSSARPVHGENSLGARVGEVAA